MLHFQAVHDLLPPGTAKDALEKALDRADQAIVEGRDAIQDLRSSTAAGNDLADAVSGLGKELASGQDDGARFSVSVEGRPRELHVEKGLACTDFARGPVGPVALTEDPRSGGLSEQLVQCDHFVLRRFSTAAPMYVDAGQL